MLFRSPGAASRDRARNALLAYIGKQLKRCHITATRTTLSSYSLKPAKAGWQGWVKLSGSKLHGWLGFSILGTKATITPLNAPAKTLASGCTH